MNTVDDLPTILRKLAKAFCFSIPLWGIALFSAFQQSPELDSMGTNGSWSVIGLLALMVSMMLFVRPLASLIAVLVADHFIFSSEQLGTPPPLYKSGEFLIKEGRYEEAAREYERIVEYHPEELNAHLALLQIWRDFMPDRKKESHAYHRALRCIRLPRDLEALKSHEPARVR